MISRRILIGGLAAVAAPARPGASTAAILLP